MNLHFMTTWPASMPENYAGQETMFPEKIWYCDRFEMIDFTDDYESNFDEMDFDDIMKTNPKLHTIRSLTKKGVARWKPGIKIHFKIWTGKAYNSKTINFLPVIECTAVQSFKISWHQSHGSKEMVPVILIDGRLIGDEEIEELAINDGFECVKGFLHYFKNDFEGQIIHWTDKLYAQDLTLSNKLPQS